MIPIKGDGNCGFRSISYALTGSENNHEKIRHDIIANLEKSWENQDDPGNDWWSKWIK